MSFGPARPGYRRLGRSLAALTMVCSLSAADRASPDEVLARLQTAMRDAATRIPNYTCVETIERRTFALRPSSPIGPRFNQQPPRECEELATLKRGRGYRLEPADWDRLRLDVRVGGAGEDYSWVGAERFDDRDLSEIVGGYGVIADGPFGALLLSVFQNSAAEFSFVGEQALERRSLYAYSFRIPLQSSHFFVHIRPGPTEITGYEGTLFVDPATSELVRLAYHAVDLPPDLGNCELGGALDYGRVRIGDSDILLPKVALQGFAPLSQREYENVITFSSCREYRAESELVTENRAVPQGAPAPAPAPAEELPPGLPVVVELISPIDSAVAAQGDPFTARLAKPIVDARKREIAPAGAVMRGRLSQVSGPVAGSASGWAAAAAAISFLGPISRLAAGGMGIVRIGFRPETIEIAGRVLRFQATGKTNAADLRQMEKRFASRGIPMESVLLRGGGTGWYSFPGDRKILEPGFRMEWETGVP